MRDGSREGSREGARCSSCRDAERCHRRAVPAHLSFFSSFLLARLRVLWGWRWAPRFRCYASEKRAPRRRRTSENAAPRSVDAPCLVVSCSSTDTATKETAPRAMAWSSPCGALGSCVVVCALQCEINYCFTKQNGLFRFRLRVACLLSIVYSASGNCVLGFWRAKDPSYSYTTKAPRSYKSQRALPPKRGTSRIPARRLVEGEAKKHKPQHNTDDTDAHQGLPSTARSFYPPPRAP